MIYLSLGLGYLIMWVRKKGAPKFLCILFISYFAFTPYYAQNSIAMWKDPVFSVVVALISTLLFDLIITKGVWVDGMCIPANSKNKEAAQVFIDFMCRPDIAFMNQQYIYYCSPITEAVNMMTEEERSLEYLNPPQDVIDRCEFFNDILDYADLYEEVWMEIRMAG